MYIGLHVKYRYCCQILMELEFSRNIFEKFSHIEFHENPSSGSRVVPYGRIDTNYEANGRFSPFCYYPNKIKSLTQLTTVVATYQ